MKMKFYFELGTNEKSVPSDVAMDVQEVKVLSSRMRCPGTAHHFCHICGMVILQSRLAHSLVAQIDSSNDKRYHFTDKRLSRTHPVLALHLKLIT